MKFEIELKDTKRTSNKQKYVLKTFLDKARSSYDAKHFRTFLESVDNYNTYVETLQGKRNTSLKIPSLKSLSWFGVDKLAQKQPNHFLKLEQQLYQVRQNHSPKATAMGKWIGVEIECFIPTNEDPEYDDDGDLIDFDETSFRARLVRKIEARKIKYVSIHGDGSIDEEPDHVPVEFAILTRIDDMTNLKRLCDLLKDMGARVNASCGLHIHLDQRDVSGTDRPELRRRLARLNQALPLLTKIVPKSRRENTYCKVSRSRLKNRDRYMAINTQALTKFGTFEIRLHSGTTDFIKISNWMKLCYGISRCEKIKNTKNHLIESIEVLKNKYLTDMSLDMFNYFVQRIDKFAPKIGPVLNPLQSQDEIVESREYRLDNSDQGIFDEPEDEEFADLDIVI